MSRGTLYSPITSFDRMPGASAGRYSSTIAGYTRPSVTRTPVGSRKSYSLVAHQTPIPLTTRPPMRPLPSGPGPLDSSGRKITNYSSSTSSYRTKSSSSNLPPHGPLRADHTKDYTGMYGASIGGRKYSPSSASSTSSLKGRRSTSLQNLNHDISGLKISDHESSVKSRYSDIDSRPLSRRRESDIESHTLPRRRDSDLEHLSSSSTSSRRFERDRDSSDDLLRTSSRTSRMSSRDANYKSETDSSFNKRTELTSSPSQDIAITPSKRLGHEHENGLDHSPKISGYSRDRDIINGESTIGTTTKSILHQENGIESPTKSPSRQNSSSCMVLKTKYNNGGKVGLRNLGNTCFMNSVLHCLSNTKPLLEFCLKDDYMLDKNSTSSMKGAVITAYANLMASMWHEKGDSYLSPNNFKTQIQKFAPRFMGYAQQDAQEFLRYLLEGLHEDVNRVVRKPKPCNMDDDKFSSDSEKAQGYWKAYLKFDNSKIVEIFVGQLKSELKFTQCGHTSVTFDPFWDLSLPIPKGRYSDLSLQDCISLFMKEENLEDDERPTCAKCKQRRACTKSFSIQKFPSILVLHLKRFSQERFSRKMTNSVDFPATGLDLTDFAAEKGGPRVLYNLYAVSNHSGSTHSGHYTAYSKHPYSGEWNYFNDTRVSPAQVRNVVSSEAYVLFYELASQSSRL